MICLHTLRIRELLYHSFVHTDNGELICDLSFPFSAGQLIFELSVHIIYRELICDLSFTSSTG